MNTNRLVNAHLVATSIKEMCCGQARACSELFCEPIKNCTNDQHSSMILVIIHHSAEFLLRCTATETAFSSPEHKEKLCLSKIN